ncbi:unnamed protein product, partial [Chrysoparadoxa australica]
VAKKTKAKAKAKAKAKDEQGKGATPSNKVSVVDASKTEEGKTSGKKPSRKSSRASRSSSSNSAESAELKENKAPTETKNDEAEKEPEQPAKKRKVDAAPTVQLGANVSGRVWKSRNQSQKASQQQRLGTKTLRKSFQKKEAEKARAKAVREREQAMKDAIAREIEAKKEARLEKEKRRQANELRSATYQSITKTHKLKGMNKKQLRQIKKTQVNVETGEVELVSPWGGGKQRVIKKKDKKR